MTISGLFNRKICQYIVNSEISNMRRKEIPDFWNIYANISAYIFNNKYISFMSENYFNA